MTCKNCNAYLSDNMNYCPICNAPVERPQYSDSAQHNHVSQQAPPPIPVGALNNNSDNNNKNKIIMAIIICVTVIIVAFIVFATVAFISKTNSNTEITKYQALLQSQTSDPVIDVQAFDFDKDTNQEAYVITGIKTVDGFENSDIWFIDCQGKIFPIKHNINGRTGTVVYTSGKIPYVTYEIYNIDRTTHNTYVYGVRNSSYYEPSISGRYIDLHLDENNRLVGQSTSGGGYIQFDFNDAFEIVKLYVNENSKPAQPSTTKATPTTSKAVIEKTTKNQNNNGYLTATDSDFSDFKNMADTLIAFRDGMTLGMSYNSSSSGAYKYAIMSTFNIWGNMFDYCSDKYGWSGARQNFNYSGYDNNNMPIYSTPDPLKKIRSYHYAKIDGAKIDWVLKNVFNVSPNHNMDSTKLSLNDHEQWYEYYYYNGYYYFGYGDGGDAAPTFSITSKEQLSDGSYKIKAKASNYEGSSAGNYTFKTALRKVDGNKVWTIFSIS